MEHAVTNGKRAPASAGQPPPVRQDSQPDVAGEEKKLGEMCSRIDERITDNVNMRRPKNVKLKLKPHQMEALKWMLAKEMEKSPAPSGGILADDMGLGKTATVIALIMKSKEKKYLPTPSDDGSDCSDDETAAEYRSVDGKPKGGTLIVCPPTLIDHWEQEVMLHVESRGLSVAKHHGPTRTKEPQKLAQLSEVVITTYGVVRSEANKGALFKMSWERVILDEAHEVRNPESRGCEAVSSLEADHRWCVTGTPIHNSLLDLHSLFKFLNWAPFTNKEAWESLIGVDELKSHKFWALLKRASLMRRTKREYSDGSSLALPRKEIILEKVFMDLNERATYDQVANYADTIREAGFTVESKKKRKKMYCMLLLRQLSNHPSLLKENSINEDLDLDEPISVDDSDQEADDKQLNRTHVQIKEEWNGTKKDLQQYLGWKDFSAEFFDSSRPSTKMEKMLEIVRRVLKNNDKVVIVSQWTNMLKLISSYLKDNNISHGTISGDIPNQERPKVVNDFNDPSNALKVLLLSLKAGGVGLNLVGGNHLILFDPHWNPQLEIQACDRIYRMGQLKPVTIYKLIVTDTIEEVIRQKQKAKLSLADSVLDNPSVRAIRNMTTLAESSDALSEMLHHEAMRRTKKRKAVDDGRDQAAGPSGCASGNLAYFFKK